MTLIRRLRNAIKAFLGFDSRLNTSKPNESVASSDSIPTHSIPTQVQSTQERSKPKDLKETLEEISIKGVALSELLAEDDFVIVGNNVDITKDGLLKLLNTIPKYDLTVEIIKENTEKIIMKAIIRTEQRKAEGFGVASLTEVFERRKVNPRAEHDALALAETRAVKRAIEWLLGTAVVNMAVKRLISQGLIKVEDETPNFNTTPNPKYRNYYKYTNDTTRYVISDEIKKLNDIVKNDIAKEVKSLEVKEPLEEKTTETQKIETKQEEVDMNIKEVNEKIEKESQIDYASLYRKQLGKVFSGLYKDEEPDYSKLDEPEEGDYLEDEPIEIDDEPDNPEEPEEEAQSTQQPQPTQPHKQTIQQPNQSTQPQPTQTIQQPKQQPNQSTRPYQSTQPHYNKGYNNYNYNNYNKGYNNYNKGYYKNGNGNSNGNGNDYYKMGQVSQKFVIKEYTKRRRIDLRRILDDYEIDNILMNANNWSQWVEVVKGRLEAILERPLSEQRPSELMKVIVTEFPPFIEIEKV